MTAASLRGAAVLVTRAEGDQGELGDILASAGAQPIPFPCIAFAPPEDTAALDAALGALGGDAGAQAVAVASPQAARQLVARLRALGREPSRSLRGLLLAAAGAGTARALQEAGLRAEVVPTTATGADALAAALAPRVRGLRVLLPCAERSNPALLEGLRRAGAAVEAVTAYRTLVPPFPDPRGLAALRASKVDGILFGSGSAARGFAALLGPEAVGLAAGARIACMGRLCAEEARGEGLPVHAVAEGGFPELVEALGAALARRAASAPSPGGTSTR